VNLDRTVSATVETEATIERGKGLSPLDPILTGPIPSDGVESPRFRLARSCRYQIAIRESGTDVRGPR
jgi:hypothetical protein